jgi:hypothetical protein
MRDQDQDTVMTLAGGRTMKVHPAAALFPMMSDAELDELAKDIAANGLQHPIVYLGNELLDGRNRAAAIARIPDEKRRAELIERLHTKDFEITNIGDPIAYVISANLHRRHLTAEKKREVIAALLTAEPEKSDRAIAKEVNVSPTTVGTVRGRLEQAGDVPKLDTHRDTRGRQQPATKAPSLLSRLKAGDMSRSGYAEPAPATSPASPDTGGEVVDRSTEFLWDRTQRTMDQDPRLRARVELLASSGEAMRKFSRFLDRRLSERTIKALLSTGHTYPEQLLFLTPAEYRAIKGIGEEAAKEIAAYRECFIPKTPRKLDLQRKAGQSAEPAAAHTPEGQPPKRGRGRPKGSRNKHQRKAP